MLYHIAFFPKFYFLYSVLIPHGTLTFPPVSDQLLFCYFKPPFAGNTVNKPRW